MYEPLNERVPVPSLLSGRAPAEPLRELVTVRPILSFKGLTDYGRYGQFLMWIGRQEPVRTKFSKVYPGGGGAPRPVITSDD